MVVKNAEMQTREMQKEHLQICTSAIYISNAEHIW